MEPSGNLDFSQIQSEKTNIEESFKKYTKKYVINSRQTEGACATDRARRSGYLYTGDADGDDDDDDDDRDADDAVAVATAAMRARIFIGSHARVIARG